METITYKEYLEYLLSISTLRSEQEKLKQQIKEIENKESDENE